MGIIGGSTSKSTTNTAQQGIEGNNDIVQGANATYTDYFPDTVAKFAGDVAAGAFGIANKAVDAATQSQQSLGHVAEVTKSPEENWLPFVLIGAAALVAIAYLRS
jgi:serine/threonine protein kinase HipA of HipAB toxin-antitoxin module